MELTPLEFLKAQEIKNRDAKGEVYLGKVMTIHYAPGSVDIDKKYFPFLLELTDVLKTPLRKSYRMVLKAYSDSSGSVENNLRLSLKRAEALKIMLVKNFYMKPERITIKAYGEDKPLASNETAAGRELNRRLEIHVHGDISEAVRFID